MLPLTKILCSTDWSEPSLTALKTAGEWAAHFGAELLVIHVVPPLEHGGLLLDKSQLEDSLQADAVQKLHQLIREQLPGLANTRPLVRLGSPAEQIALAAREEAADLLVIATRGQGAVRSLVSGTFVGRIFQGSVASRVMQLTPCPFLTIH